MLAMVQSGSHAGRQSLRSLWHPRGQFGRTAALPPRGLLAIRRSASPHRWCLCMGRRVAQVADLPFFFCSLFLLCALFSKRNEDEEATDKLYTHVTHVNVPTFKGLSTVAVKDE